MQSEEIDYKAKEAAEHHHPPYDEKAWDKMEKLLNKHLPQRKDDWKKIALILFFLLFLGTSGYLLLTRPWQGSANKSNSSVSKTETKPASPTSDNTVNNEIKEKATTKETSVKADASVDFVAPVSKKDLVSGNKKPYQQKAAIQIAKTRTQDTKILITDPKLNDPLPSNKETVISNINKEKISEPVSNEKQEKIIVPVEAGKNPDAVAEAGKSDKKPAEAKVATATKKSKGKGKGKGNSLLFTASIGPDVSAVGTEDVGSVQATYGAGLGYTFGKKWTIRAGLYSSRKLYDAAPYAYHPPDYFWQYYPDLQMVEADCRVLEIPVTMSYNFSHSEKNSWMGTVGLSTYLMKRETYNYIYKNTSGQIQSWEATIHNVNKHYFTVLTLGGAYERKINKNISFMVEPYLKIPLSGVGYGKVKLTSAGALFTLGIRPFQR